ncbi:hypothetical protein MYAM1_001393 [Malassezia yamatoensis]|uniref:Uncharacterized protein n=1 Tax=Malassezia yamatoensis TaxID=253288 RepID=A0AAJ5YW28_9BASI|nr:hypothetical protein MYAM1_001393 [Malassezia yamatoensis]
MDAEAPSDASFSRSNSRQGKRLSASKRDSQLSRRRSTQLQSTSNLGENFSRPNSRAAESNAHYASADEQMRPSSRLARSSSVSRQRELADSAVGTEQFGKTDQPRPRKPKPSSKSGDSRVRPERRKESRTAPSDISRTRESRKSARGKPAPGSTASPRRRRRPQTESNASVPPPSTRAADLDTNSQRQGRPAELSKRRNRPTDHRADPTRRVRRVRSEAFYDAPGDERPAGVSRRLSLNDTRPTNVSSLDAKKNEKQSKIDPLGLIYADSQPSKSTSSKKPHLLSAFQSPPASVTGSSRRFLSALPFMNRGGTPSNDSVNTRSVANDAKSRAAQEKADARVLSIQAKAEAKQRAADTKLDARRSAMESKVEAKQRVAAAKVEAKEAVMRRKLEAKEQAASTKEQKKQASELARQRKLDLKERRIAEKQEAKSALERQRETQKTEELAVIRERERQRELAEMDRKQKRLLAITPFRRREDGSEVELSAEQRHGLLKSLVMMQMQQEFLDLARPGILSQYGYPFASESSIQQQRRRVELAFWSKKKASPTELPKGVIDALHEPLILRHLYQIHLRRFPGLNNAPLSFWRKRIQPFNDAYMMCAMSTSRERSELVLTHLLSLVGTQYLGLFFARGVGVRGEDELRGPGIGEPGTEVWGAGKQWGAGTVKRGLDRPYQLTDMDYEMIDNLFYGQEYDVWIEAGQESRRVQSDWAAFKETIIEQESGMEEIVEYLSVSNVNNLPPHLQNAEEWVRIHVALMMRWLLVESPAADSLFNFLKTVHMLFPYWPARQILKIANAQVMIQMMLSLLLAQPAGTKSLFQRIIGFVISREVSSIQREYIEPIRKEISEQILAQKVEAYVRHKTTPETERMEMEAEQSGNDLLTTILLSDREPRLDPTLRAYVLDLQRAYAASPYRSRPDFAYPGTTPRGKDQPPIPGWGVTVGDASKARMFALLKLLLRESLNKRDRERFADLMSGSLVVDILKESLQLVFYDAIRDIASVADLSGRLGDLQKLLDDAIDVRKNTDNSPARWIDLANKHHEFIYFFVHECAPVAQPLWKWCQASCDYMSLSTTDPEHPADRNAENIEVNLDEMLQDQRLSSEDVDNVLREMNELTQWSRWQKIRRELEFRKNFLLALQPAQSGLCQEMIPTQSMRRAIEDIDALMLQMFEHEQVPLDDGLCDDVRGTERKQVPWAFFDRKDPLGQGILAEPESYEHRIAKPPINVRPPSLDYTRKVLPLFQELLVSKLPDWLDSEVNGEPIPQPKSIVDDSTKFLKNRRFLRRK